MRTQTLSPSGARPVNLMINGAMDLWQRIGAGTNNYATATPTAWTADRVSHHTAGPTVKSFSVTRSTNVPSAALVGTPPPYSVQITCNTTVGVLNTADRWMAFRTTIEDRDLLEATRLGFITFAFEFISTVSGTYPCRIYNFLNNRSYLSTFSYTTPGVYQQIVTQFPLEAVTGSIGFYIEHSGATYQGAPGSWLAGDFATPNTGGLVNLYTSGLVMRITNFSAFAGKVYPLRTNFYRRGNSFGEELALAQRYYEKSYDVDVVPGTITQSGFITTIWNSGNRPFTPVQFKVTKRTTPVIAIYSTGSGALGQLRGEASGTDIAAGVDASNRGQSGFSLYQGVGVGTNASGAYGHYTADAEL